jgi:2-polyprenyl-6-methoxyphenol hydroxylase-like FAD-dependent oxidoreductase
MNKLGRDAIVIGGGIGGLLAARLLSDHFERVSILERDTVDDTRDARAGVPQGKHLHALLAGGQSVLDELFPGFEDDLDRVGATRLRVGLDLRVERPGFDPFPQRDLGLYSSGLTRPQLEFCVRRRVLSIDNVSMEEGYRVIGLFSTDDRRSIAGLQYKHDGRSETRAADLVVDASGSGDLTMAALRATDHASPRETTIGVDLGYSSAVFAIPADAPSDWRGVMVLPDAPKTSRGALMIPVEGNRWMLALGGRPGEHPPADEAGFRDYAATLRTPTIARAIASAKLVAGVDRFRFNESRLQHFDELQTFPAGLLPLGDAISRFNPVFGQGMSVAAQQAHALGKLLAQSASGEIALADLWRPFFTAVAALVDTPWALAAVPDFIFPQTRGVRPADFEMSLQFGLALNRAAARHEDIHRLAAEIQHLLRPRSALMEPHVIERVMAEMSNPT